MTLMHHSRASHTHTHTHTLSHTLLYFYLDPGTFQSNASHTHTRVCPFRNGEASTYDATTTPGRALLFRKDLEHEGVLLEVSHKKKLMNTNKTHTHARTHTHTHAHTHTLSLSLFLSLSLSLSVSLSRIHARALIFANISSNLLAGDITLT
jgi:hypothetical protein